MGRHQLQPQEEERAVIRIQPCSPKRAESSKSRSLPAMAFSGVGVVTAHHMRIQGERD